MRMLRPEKKTRIAAQKFNGRGSSPEGLDAECPFNHTQALLCGHTQCYLTYCTPRVIREDFLSLDLSYLDIF